MSNTANSSCLIVQCGIFFLAYFGKQKRLQITDDKTVFHYFQEPTISLLTVAQTVLQWLHVTIGGIFIVIYSFPNINFVFNNK